MVLGPGRYSGRNRDMYNSGAIGGATGVIPTKITDACAAGAVCLFGVSLATINLVVQIVAGLLAAIAATISIYGAYGKWKRTGKWV